MNQTVLLGNNTLVFVYVTGGRGAVWWSFLRSIQKGLSKSQ